jgi:hypothetical protein
MKDITKADLDVICEAMGSQYRSLTDLARTNIPHAVRTVTELEANKVMKVWEKVERYKNSLPTQTQEANEDKLSHS